jgi:hypothetical protein
MIDENWDHLHVRRNNIRRYRRLLQAELTELGRAPIHRKAPERREIGDGKPDVIDRPPLKSQNRFPMQVDGCAPEPAPVTCRFSRIDCPAQALPVAHPDRSAPTLLDGLKRCQSKRPLQHSTHVSSKIAGRNLLIVQCWLAMCRRSMGRRRRSPLF